VAKQEASEFAGHMASLQADITELLWVAVLAVETDDRRRHEAAAQAAKALALVEERRCHKAVLAAEADEQRRHEAAARAVEPEALNPDKECHHHESVMWASMSKVSPLADKRHRHEAADRPIASDDAVIERIQTEFALCAAPLDAILAKIACEESRHHEAVVAAEANDRRRHNAAARTMESEALTLVHRHEAETWAPLSTVSPLADERSCHEAAAGATASAQLALAVHPHARPRRCTGQRNIPRAPSCFVKVAPTHPELLQGGLPTPTSTMLAQAISPCRSVSSPMPILTTPHTPSLHPFTFDDGTLLSSGGGNAHPFCEQGLPLPPWKRTRRKYRPHRTCQRHQPHAPNQSTGWA